MKSMLLLLPVYIDTASCLQTSSILKITKEKEALVNVVEIGEIETEERPSRKGP